VAIFKYFNRERYFPAFRESFEPPLLLRYGENPHQKGIFFGKLEEVFDKLHGKEISYNNLLDIDAALSLSFEFSDPAFIITKHTNACGVAERDNIFDAWKDALACDPVSAYGGVLACNRPIDEKTANEIDKLFFEIIISPGYEPLALEILKHKKNRIILLQKDFNFSPHVFRSNLNGVLWQERDNITEDISLMQPVTVRVPDKREYDDLAFALKIVKHSKSNAIVLAMNKQLYASGVGQTSRIDALKHAVEKAGMFGFNLNGAVLASDAFFPFADCVEMAQKAGITAIVQPGGSIRDQDSIDLCNKHNIAMVFTGIRHFKH